MQFNYRRFLSVSNLQACLGTPDSKWLNLSAMILVSSNILVYRLTS